MTSCRKKCSRQARKRRHCLDSLEIPFQHPCLSSLPGCKPPPCQVSIAASHGLPEQDYQNHPPSNQIAPSAFVSHPASPIKLPLCQIRPKSPNPIEVTLSHQFGLSGHQNVPTNCTLKPTACQKSYANQSIALSNDNIKTPYVIRNPFCHWNQDPCPAITSCGSTNLKTFCHHSNDEDSVTNRDYNDFRIQPQGGSENEEETNIDRSHYVHDSSDNSQKERSYNDDKYENNLVTDSKTSSKVDQSGNKLQMYTNDEENVAPTKQSIHKEHIEGFSSAAGSAKSKMMSADNNNLAGTKFHCIESETDLHSNNATQLQILQNERFPRSFNELVALGENPPQPIGNMESTSLWQTVPCCQSSYSKNNHTISPKIKKNINAVQEFNNKQTSRNAHNNYHNNSYESFKGMTTNKTRQNKDDDEYQDCQEGPSGSFRGQRKQSVVENINNFGNFKASCCSSNMEKSKPKIIESSYPKSGSMSSSNMQVRSGSKVHVPTSTTCPHTPDLGSCDKNVQETVPSAYRIDPGTTKDKSDKSFRNAMTIKEPGKFADCCKRGISTLIVKDAECVKNTACVKDVGSSTCTSTTCFANKMESGCGCRYPPAFQQFSCAGNINGTCNCNDKTQ